MQFSKICFVLITILIYLPTKVKNYNEKPKIFLVNHYLFPLMSIINITGIPKIELIMLSERLKTSESEENTSIMRTPNAILSSH